MKLKLDLYFMDLKIRNDGNDEKGFCISFYIKPSKERVYKRASLWVYDNQTETMIILTGHQGNGKRSRITGLTKRYEEYISNNTTDIIDGIYKELLEDNGEKAYHALTNKQIEEAISTVKKARLWSLFE